MEIIIIVALAVIVYVGYKVLNTDKTDSAHPSDAATQAPYKVEITHTTKVDGIGHESVPAKSVLDVNGDGKVNLEDAKAAVKKTKKQVKEVVEVVTETVKKPKGRKPKAQ